MSKELQIRNSTVDFLVFTRDAGEDGIEVRVQNGDVWLTQKAISQLFDVDRSVVTKHLSNIQDTVESLLCLTDILRIFIRRYPRLCKCGFSYTVKRTFAIRVVLG